MSANAPSAELPKIMIRLTPELKAWLASEAKRNASSQNSEAVRCIRERMEREATAHAR